MGNFNVAFAEEARRHLQKPNAPKPPRDDRGYRHRAGCLPLSKDGTKVLLITSSRDKNKWILPAGTLEEGEHPTLGAVRETEEEAGVRGVLRHALALIYDDEKNKSKTHYYIMRVYEEDTDWGEGGFRERCWFTLNDAMEKLSWRPAHKKVLYDYLQASQVITKVTKLTKLIHEEKKVTEHEAAEGVWHHHLHPEKKLKQKTKEVQPWSNPTPQDEDHKKQQRQWIAERMAFAIEAVDEIKKAPVHFKHTPTLVQLAHESDIDLKLNESNVIVTNINTINTDLALHLNDKAKILETEPVKKWLKVLDRMANCAEFSNQHRQRKCVKNFLAEEYYKRYFNQDPEQATGGDN